MILKGIEQLKRYREAQQQYATPTQERNSIPSNSEGAPGDTVIVNQEGSKSIYVKTQGEWYNTSLQRQSDNTRLASSTITEVNETTGTPSVSMSSTIIGRRTVELTFNITNENGFVIKRREGSNFVSGTNEVEIATSGTSPITDTNTAHSTQYAYRLTATNNSGPNSVDTVITTLSASSNFNINFIDVQSGPDDAWSDGDLIECAEFVELNNSDSINQMTKYLDNTDFSNGGILYNNSNATTPFDGEAFNTQATGNNFFSMNGDVDKIFQVASNGLLSNVISCIPTAPSVTLTVVSSSQINLSITGDMRVARNLEIQRKPSGGSYSTIATIAPSAKGNLANINVTTPYNNTTGLSASTEYFYQVRAKNDTHNGIYSDPVSATTSAAGVSWSNVPSDFSIEALGFNGVEFSSGKTITLNNGANNSIITCSNSGLTGTLTVAASTSSTPSYSATYTSSVTISNATTYYLRFRYQKLKANTENNTQTITFTNSSVSNTDLDIQCIGL